MNNIPCDSIPVRTLTYKNPKTPKASEERHEAICRFVDILTPQEIKGLTKFYAETWTVGEFLHYSHNTGDILYAQIEEETYKVINKCKGTKLIGKSMETKLHLSFRYKFQKFAYVLVSLKNNP